MNAAFAGDLSLIGALTDCTQSERLPASGRCILQSIQATLEQAPAALNSSAAITPRLE